LEESGLKDCIDKHFEEILYDIEASKLPSRTMKQDLEGYKNLLSELSEIGVKAIILEGKPYSPVTGLRKAKSLLKKRGKITIGLAYEKFILKEKTIGTLPLGTFYNENLGKTGLSEIEHTLRGYGAGETEMGITIKTEKSGRRTIYIFTKKKIKNLNELVEQ